MCSIVTLCPFLSPRTESEKAAISGSNLRCNRFLILKYIKLHIRIDHIVRQTITILFWNCYLTRWQPQPIKKKWRYDPLRWAACDERNCQKEAWKKFGFRRLSKVDMFYIIVSVDSHSSIWNWAKSSSNTFYFLI